MPLAPLLVMEGCNFADVNIQSIPRFMVRAALLAVLLFTGPNDAVGQIIDNRLGNAFQDEMFFNQEFLWTNKVQAVTMNFAIKRPGRPIEQRPDLTVFRFNEVGLLQRMEKVTSVLQLRDSLVVEYKRNGSGAVESKTENSRKGVFVTQFVYDKEGRLVREDYGKAENISAQKGKVETGPSVGVNSETYQWTEIGEGKWKKSMYNNYGLLYAHWYIEKNKLGYVIKEEEELVMSARTTIRTYEYNDKGWVSRVVTKDNQGGKEKEARFVYDDWGNLLKMVRFENGVAVDETEVLYTETMLIEAILVEDLSSHDIEIRKFSYEFH